MGFRLVVGWLGCVVLLVSVVLGSYFEGVDAKSRLRGNSPTSLRRRRSATNDQGLVVEIDSGKLQGLIMENSRAFLGVPFADPPVGEFRWANPRPVSPWSGIRDATSYSAGCMQRCELPPNTCPEHISEDCLYLNVFAPLVDRVSQPVPVMLFLHGGRFEQGAAGMYLYSGIDMVNVSNAIIVTTNYRLGALGFLVTENLAGNYGIEDQRAVLRWIQRNIAKFGGDPTKVTIFGQSAGATSIAYHMVSQNSKDLFHRAILQSNPWALPLKNVKQASEAGELYAKHLNCHPNDVVCLRSRSAEDAVIAQTKTNPISLESIFLSVYRFAPVVGTPDVPDQPLALFQKGLFYDIPVILGSLKNEGRMFIWMFEPNPLPEWMFDAAVALIFHFHDTNEILKHYPIPSDQKDDTRSIMGEMGTDYMFYCPQRSVSNAIRKFSSQNKHYVYFFDRALPWPGVWGPDYSECVGYVCHGSELIYEFDSARFGNYSYLPGGQVLSNSMMRYWTSFATSEDANPNNFYAPTWTPYSSDLQSAIQLNVPISSVQRRREEFCDFWDTVGYNH